MTSFYIDAGAREPQRMPACTCSTRVIAEVMTLPQTGAVIAQLRCSAIPSGSADLLMRSAVVPISIHIDCLTV